MSDWKKGKRGRRRICGVKIGTVYLIEEVNYAISHNYTCKLITITTLGKRATLSLLND